MATPQPSNPTQPSANATPAQPSNPLQGTGWESLGDEISDLRAKMDSASLSARQLAQQQANTIDYLKAISELRSKESISADKLKLSISNLEANILKAGRGTLVQGKALADLRTQLDFANTSIRGMAAASTILRDVTDELIAHSDKLTAREKSPHRVLAMDQAGAAAGVIGKTAGPITNTVKALSSLLGVTKLLGSAAMAPVVSGVGLVVGGLLLALEPLAFLFKAATRESTTYANVFGASVGLGVQQQLAFRNSIGLTGKATFATADIQKLGSAAMKAGAYDMFTANMMASKAGETYADKTKRLSAELGLASLSMMQMGRVLGYTAEQSGALLASFATTMGALDASLPGAVVELGKVMGKFGQMSKLTGQSLTTLFSTVGGFSETTLPMGVKFDTLTMHTAQTMRALGDYGKAMGESGDQYLRNSANVAKLTQSMFAYGSSITPVQMAGYDLAMGLDTTKEPFAAILDNISRDPMEKLSTQLKTFQAKTGSVDAALVGMMGQGLKPEIVNQLRGVMKNADAAKAFGLLSGPGGKKAYDKAIADFPPEMQKTMADLATAMQLGRSPMEQLVTLTQNSVDFLARIMSVLERLSGAKLMQVLTAPARLSLKPKAPLGNF